MKQLDLFEHFFNGISESDFDNMNFQPDSTSLEVEQIQQKDVRLEEWTITFNGMTV